MRLRRERKQEGERQESRGGKAMKERVGVEIVGW